MLILPRTINQSFMIGDDIEVCLRSIQGEEIELEVTAPPEVSVYSEEAYEKISSTQILSTKGE